MLKSMSRTSSLCLLLALPTAVANAGETVEFYRVGDGLSYAVSDDGSTVVGLLSSGSAFAWTEGDGLSSIGGIEAVGANSDGSAICGGVSTPSGESAGRLLLGATWEPFGGLGASGCDANLSSGYDISSNGARCVGLGWDGCSANAFLWEEGIGIAALPAMGTSSTRADTISGDGHVIGGWDQLNGGNRLAAVWREDAAGQWNEELLLQGMSGNSTGRGEINGSNGDGSVLLGTSTGTTTASKGAFVFREASGVEVLGILAGSLSPTTGGFLDTTEDGATIVGFQREGLGGSGRFRATIWTNETGLTELKPYLNALGANIPESFTLAAGMSISDDGRVICGWGYDGWIFAQEAWIAILPGTDAPCPADFNGDGVVDGADLGLLLSGFGTAEATYDLNGDGEVNGADLGLFLAAFGPCT